eukprot:6183045-Pleurochrysis_carterae.AAC.1
MHRTPCAISSMRRQRVAAADPPVSSMCAQAPMPESLDIIAKVRVHAQAASIIAGFVDAPSRKSRSCACARACA